ncbi:hypothetical protein [Rhizobium arsenicireducens]
MHTSDLLTFYEGPNERVGFILKTGEIIEVPNVCSKPTDGFDVAGVDIVEFTPLAVATWHTHPDSDSNLSASDWHTFLSWPDLDHYIIGNDGVTKFVVQDGDILIEA